MNLSVFVELESPFVFEILKKYKNYVTKPFIDKRHPGLKWKNSFLCFSDQLENYRQEDLIYFKKRSEGSKDVGLINSISDIIISLSSRRQNQEYLTKIIDFLTQNGYSWPGHSIVIYELLRSNMPEIAARVANSYLYDGTINKRTCCILANFTLFMIADFGDKTGQWEFARNKIEQKYKIVKKFINLLNYPKLGVFRIDSFDSFQSRWLGIFDGGDLDEEDHEKLMELIAENSQVNKCHTEKR